MLARGAIRALSHARRAVGARQQLLGGVRLEFGVEVLYGRRPTWTRRRLAAPAGCLPLKRLRGHHPCHRFFSFFSAVSRSASSCFFLNDKINASSCGLSSNLSLAHFTLPVMNICVRRLTHVVRTSSLPSYELRIRPGFVLVVDSTSAADPPRTAAGNIGSNASYASCLNGFDPTYTFTVAHLARLVLATDGGASGAGAAATGLAVASDIFFYKGTGKSNPDRHRMAPNAWMFSVC